MREGPIPDAEIPYRRHGIPPLGFREYWYPALPAREIGRKPRALRMLGEDIVLFRDGGRIFALADRCPHRGVRLSAGKCMFPGSGTISCPYHGWTFDGKSGGLVAALMEGPGSTMVGKAAVKTFPVAEHLGLVFVHMGEDAPGDLLAELPDVLRPGFFHITRHVDYACNWRPIVDNWPNDHHGPYVHRNSPELAFQKFMPFGLDIEPIELEDGQSIAARGKGGMTSGVFPGLGAFPRDTWRRFLKPTGRGNRESFETSPAFVRYGIKAPSATRLPGMVIVGRRSGEYFLLQWAVPIDESRTRLFNINCFRRRGRWRELYDRVHYALWRGWAHDWIFSGQDRAVVEQLVPGPERLSRTDIGVIAWRKLAGRAARRPARERPEERDAS